MVEVFLRHSSLTLSSACMGLELTLVLFNNETHEIRNLEMHGCGNALGLWAICYKECLVSLFGQNDEDGRRGYQFSDAVHDFFITGCSKNLGFRNPNPK
ncbi:unnamed protein product [Camellia sinensis]